VGENQDGAISNSFWDVNTSGWPTSAGGTPKTTGEMKTKSTFTDVGWDFANVWHICEGVNYPKLRWEVTRGDLVCPYGIDFTDFVVLASAWGSQSDHPHWNPECDISLRKDSRINEADLAVFCENWLMGGDPCIPDDIVLIPSGRFEMGDNFGEGWDDERPVHTVTVDSFYMGKYEIINRQYCDYLNSAKSSGQIKIIDSGIHPIWGVYPSSDTTNSYLYRPLFPLSIEYSDGVFTVSPSLSDQPADAITWYGAAAYCNWRSQEEGYEQCYDLSTWICDFSKKGYHLPTEAEWEYAARGGLAGRRFPWGDTISHTQANYYSWEPGTGYRPPYDVSPTWGDHPVHGPIAPVGRFAPNGYGLYDVAGNILEWCNDWYDSDYYDSSPTANPTGPGGGTGRVLRGGSWGRYSNSAQICRVAYRGFLSAESYDSGLGYCDLGFRLVLDLN
jgi:formylglycine-generating enzyme required for sulfatase activity